MMRLLWLFLLACLWTLCQSERDKRQAVIFPGQQRRPTRPGRPIRPSRPTRPNRPSGSGQGGGVVFPGSSGGGGGGGGSSPIQSASCQRGETCTSFSECASFFQDLQSIRASQCELQGVGTGVCCPNRSPSGGGRQVFTEPRLNVPMRDLSRGELNAACNQALNQLRTRRQLQSRLFSEGIFLQRGSPGARLLSFFQPTDEADRLAQDGLANILACENLFHELNLTPLQGSYGLSRFSVLDTVLKDTCPREPRCNPRSKYRTADGSCNNLAEPLWGRSNTAFQRVLPPDYADGIFAPRVSSSGNPLPSARLVSSSVAIDRNNPFQTLTLLVMQWGQFLDHDLTLGPVFKGEEGRGIKCCRNGRALPENLRNPACLPIEIPRNDPFFAQFGEECMEFVRTMVAPRPRCDFGFAEQLNALTHFIDGSMVYGSEQETANALRSFRGGRLNTQRNPQTGSDNLPPSVTEEDECTNFTTNIVCFRGGDVRVNEQVDLTVMHLIWVREHNRVAGQLSRINPRWNDETLYQETRRIVGAMIQHITYNEWLPLIVGKDYLELFGINARRFGFADIYNPSVNPSVTNEFQSAAFRFGHSLLQGQLQLFNDVGRSSGSIDLETQFNSPFLLNSRGALDSLTRGLCNQESQKFDRFFTDSVTNRLFQGSNRFGLDLVSLNLQRAREHGIPGYNAYRELCGLRKARSFNDLAGEISSDTIRTFRQIYNSVDDIDLFIGGVSESPRPGAILGPTFACLVTDTFARVRLGDRFSYDLRNEAGSFTEAQLDQIRRSSMARVLCDNSDNISKTQPLAFLSPSSINRPVDCNSNLIPRMFLDSWIGERAG